MSFFRRVFGRERQEPQKIFQETPEQAQEADQQIEQMVQKTVSRHMFGGLGRIFNRETVDEDLFPMVVVDVDRGRARVVQRRPFQPDASSANARTVTAPATVDSASAVSLAKQLVGRESTLHCVIESARAFDVEMLPSAHPVGTTIRGQTVLVPRGGPVQVIGVFELPSDK